MNVSFNYKQRRENELIFIVFQKIHKTIKSKPNVTNFNDSSRPLKYRTNFTNCIQEAFEMRGYEKTFDDDWDIIWS